MNLKMIISMIVFISAFQVASRASAQGTAKIDVENLKSILQQERETIFIEALQLTVEQATAFHPISTDFNNEKRMLDDMLIKLIIRYANNYNLLDKEIMASFIKKSKQFQLKELAIRKKYYKRISKEISVEVASQFYEVDDFVSTSLRLSVLTGLPFTNSVIQHIERK